MKSTPAPPPLSWAAPRTARGGSRAGAPSPPAGWARGGGSTSTACAPTRAAADPGPLRGVELARTGNWPAVTGPITLTAEDLAAAARAHRCPEFATVTVRLGHTDPRFDGEPSLGLVTGLRVAGDTLVGDLVGLPGWLRVRVHASYPARSIEALQNVSCHFGHRHRLALTGLALLGLARPAVAGLADLPALVAASGAPASAHAITTPLVARARAARTPNGGTP